MVAASAIVIASLDGSDLAGGQAHPRAATASHRGATERLVVAPRDQKIGQVMNVLTAVELGRAHHALDDRPSGVHVDDVKKILRQPLTELLLGARRQDSLRLAPGQVEADAAHRQPVVEREASAVARFRRQDRRPGITPSPDTIPNQADGLSGHLRGPHPTPPQRPRKWSKVAASRLLGSSRTKVDEDIA